MYRVLQSKSSLCTGVLLIKVLYVQGSTEYGFLCTGVLLIKVLNVQGSTEYDSLCTGFY